MDKKIKSKLLLLIGYYLFLSSVASIIAAYFSKNNPGLLTYCLFYALIIFKVGLGIIQAKAWARIPAIILLVLQLIKSLISIPNAFEDMERMGDHAPPILKICVILFVLFFVFLNVFIIYYLNKVDVKRIFLTKNTSKEKDT